MSKFQKNIFFFGETGGTKKIGGTTAVPTTTIVIAIIATATVRIW